MSFHHVALATLDLDATHRFYTSAMGFVLVHVEAAESDVADGWLRHALYDTGGGELLAFMELHDDRYPDFDPAISRELGLPNWVNHLAFDAPDQAALDLARDRWLTYGLDVTRMGHTHGVSICTEDPNGNVVEWASTTLSFTERERSSALERLQDPNLTLEAPTGMEFFLAADYVPA